MASYFPIIGTWYQDIETKQRFEIVAIDEKQRTVEVQYYDGDISEFEMETWGALPIVEVEIPNEVYAGYDGVSAFASEEMSFQTMGNPLETIEPDTFTGYDDPF